MDESKKKQIMISIVVICLVLATVIAIVNFMGGRSGGGSRSTGPVPLLCVNEECGNEFEMDREELTQQMMKSGALMGPMGMGPQALTCPECNEQSAFQAVKCNKCQASFIKDYSSGDFPDRCPECDYSAIEEARENAGQ